MESFVVPKTLKWQFSQHKSQNPIFETLKIAGRKQLLGNQTKGGVIYKVVVGGETDWWWKWPSKNHVNYAWCFFACPLYINYSLFVLCFTWVTAQSQLTLPKQPFGWLKNRLNEMRGLCFLALIQIHACTLIGTRARTRLEPVTLSLSFKYYVSRVRMFCKKICKWHARPTCTYMKHG